MSTMFVSKELLNEKTANQRNDVTEILKPLVDQQTDKMKTGARKSGRGESTSHWDMRKRYESVTVKCEFCQETFNTSKAYQDHARLEHPEDVKTSWIPCKQCDLFLPSKLAMVSHKAKIHSKSEMRDATGRLSCDYCARTYKNMLDMNKHCLKDHYEILKRDWIPCPDCHLYFRNQQGLTAHTHQKHPTKNIEFGCQFCSKIFFSKDSFYEHANSFHYEEVSKLWHLNEKTKSFVPSVDESAKKKTKSKDRFQCTFCPKIFTTIDPLYQHANRYHLDDIEKQWFYNPARKMYLPKPPDTSKKPNQGPEIWCEFCTAKVHYSYVPHANKYHFDIISKIWPGCDDCKMFFPTIQSLDSHNLAKHKVSTASFRNRKLTPNRRIFKCEFCSRSFVIARLLWRHAQKEHGDVISQLWLKCDVCELHFPNAEVLAIHTTAKHNRKKSDEKESSPKCEFCEAVFSSVHICTRHANATHVEEIKEKWHKCPICDYYLQTEAALALHKGKHDETCAKKLVCQFCSSRFHYWKTYALHANKSHPDDVRKEWKFCDKCDLLFPPNDHRHFRDPDGPGQILCKFCDKGFKANRDLTEHCNATHKEEISTEWFFCQTCAEYFPTEKGLSRHQKSICRTDRKRKHEQTGEGLPRSRPRRAVSRNARYDSDSFDMNNVENFVEETEEWKSTVKIEEENIRGSSIESFRLQVEPKTADSSSDESQPLSNLKYRRRLRKTAKKEKLKPAKSEILDENFDDGDDDVTFDNVTLDINDADFDADVNHDEQDDDATSRSNVQEKTLEEIMDEEEESRMVMETEGGELEGTPTSGRGKNEKRRLAEESVVDRNGDSAETEKVLKWPFDMDKVNIEPEDLNDYKRKSEAAAKPHMESFGKRCSYKVPKTSTNIKLVTAIDRNGTETKRVQCEYCPKTHINVPVYNLHVNTEHLELAMLYWFACDSCSKYFPSEFTLMKHKRISHPSTERKPRLLCDFCSTTHCDSSSLYRHVNKKHKDCAGKSWVDCKVCGYFLPTAMSLASHILYLHPKYHKKLQESMEPTQPRKFHECSCDFCDSTFNSRDGLRDHLRGRHGDEIVKDVPTQCPLCHVTLATIESYYVHANSGHSEEIKNENWVTCHSCKMLIPSETTYIIHRKKCKSLSGANHAEEETDQIPCEFCAENFKSRSSYFVHANSAHSDLVQAAKWSQCESCNKFISPDRFESHRVKCRGHSEIVSDEEDVPSKKLKRKSKKAIVCPYCPMTFLHNHNFQFHVNQRHREKLVEDNWVACSNCPKLFVNAARLQIHQKSCMQNKPVAKKNSKVYPQKTNIKCSFCPQVFINGGKFYAHANKVHADTIASFWLPCPMAHCEARFPNMRAMRMHLVRCNETKKSGRRPEVPCQFCDAAFSDAKEVIEHANSDHPKEIKKTWLLCPGCENCFPDSKNLERHAVQCSYSTSSEGYKI